MPIIHDSINWLKNRFIYMTGRGLLGVGVLSAMPLAGSAAPVLGPIAAVFGTAILQAFVSWRKERNAEKTLLNAYREETAVQLGMAPEDVRIEHLREVADGSPEKGLKGNPIISEALHRSEKRNIMQMVTSALSGLVTLGLMFTVLDVSWAGGELKSIYSSLPVVGQFMGSRAADYIGTMFIAGTGMAVLNHAFDFVGERMIGIHKTTASGHIRDIRRDLDRGRMITQEQVFGVYVAANPELAETIAQDLGKDYFSMNQRQQHLAVERYSNGLNIGQMTYDINHYMVDPEELAFAAIGEKSGVPRRKSSEFNKRASEEVTTQKVVQEVTRAVSGEGEQPDKPKESLLSAANDNLKGFAEKFVPRRAQEADKSFVERFAPQGQKTESHAMSELEKLMKRQQELRETQR